MALTTATAPPWTSAEGTSIAVTDVASFHAGVIGRDALSTLTKLVMPGGRKIQKRPVALVSAASAATVLAALLGMYFANLHSTTAAWG